MLREAGLGRPLGGTAFADREAAWPRQAMQPQSNWAAPRDTRRGGYLDGMAAWRSTIICIICSIMAMRRSI